MKCPQCNTEMESGAMYVRGIGSALFWSKRNDVSFLSKKDLEQINLGDISTTPTGAQAVIESHRCRACGLVAFNSGTTPAGDRRK